MPKKTIALGVVLIAVGVIGYVVSDFASWTALIPSILGAAIALCGAIGLRSPKIGVHLALVVALVGAAGTWMNVAKLGGLLRGDAERPLAIIVSVITFALLVGYLIAGVRSFIAARRTPATT